MGNSGVRSEICIRELREAYIVGFNRWLGAIMVTSLLGFFGCAQPTPKASPTKAPVATNTPAPVETPEVAETPDAAPTAAATPTATGTPVAATSSGGGDAMMEDYENADGLEGYEECMKLEVVASTPESVNKGKELFAANCATCHGDDGKGGGPAGAALDPPPRDLTKADGYKYGSMELAVYRTVHYGVDGTGMAPWGDALDGPADTWALVHFVRSLQK